MTLRVCLMAGSPGRWQRGDVQEVQPASHPWSPTERASAAHRIILVDDADDDLRALLLARQVSHDMPVNDIRQRSLSLRAYYLDLDALPPGERVNAADIRAAILPRPFPLDPRSPAGLLAAGWTPSTHGNHRNQDSRDSRRS